MPEQYKAPCVAKAGAGNAIGHSTSAAQSPQGIEIPTKFSSGDAYPSCCIIPACCVVIPGGRALGLENPSELNDDEHVDGAHIMEQRNPIYGITTSAHKNRASKEATMTKALSMSAPTTVRARPRRTRFAAAVSLS